MNPSPHRITHLIDAAHPAAPVTLASLARLCPDVPYRVLVRGPAALTRQLAAFDLRCEPMARRSAEAKGAALVAWSARAGVRAAIRRHQPLLWVAFDPPGRWEAAVLKRGGGVALCFTEHMRAALEEMRLDAVRVEPVFDARLLSPAAASQRDRPENERAVALLADDPRQADALGGVLAVSIAEEAAADRPDTPRLRLVAHPESLHGARARAMADDAGRPHRLWVEPMMVRPWEILRSCDAALLWGRQTALARLWAEAAGLPVIDAADADPRRAAALLTDSPPVRREAATDVSAWRQVMTRHLTDRAEAN